MTALFERYRELMIKTRFISAFGSAFGLAIVVREVVVRASNIATLESSNEVDWDLVTRMFIPFGIVAFSLTGRLVSLARIEKVPYSAVAVSWLATMMLAWGYVSGDGRDPHHNYLWRTDVLENWFLIFLTASGIRFLLTAGFAIGTRRREVDSFT